MIASPLNYTGGKYKLLPQILPLFPENIGTFVDLFCGGCNVGLNVDARKIIYNDIDQRLVDLFGALRGLEKETTFELIDQIIAQYDLSRVSQNGYAFYHCNGADGLAEYNRERFLRLRQDFNQRTKEERMDQYYFVMFYVLVVYAFNNQIRYNGAGEYNLPVGKRDFNSQMRQKLSAFIDRIQEQTCRFTCMDFRSFDVTGLASNDFLYADPPYLITCASYNEKGGWSDQDERDLLAFLDKLHARHVRFALSNVLRSKGKENHILLNWLETHKTRYRAIPLRFNYSNSSYHTKDRTSGSEEVLIMNYERGADHAE